MVIPGTAKGIIESLMNDYHYTVKEIAEKIEVTPKTIYQILNNQPISLETNFWLTLFYIRIRYSHASTSPPIGREDTEH